MAGKWKLLHPDEDAIARWVRGETRFEMLVTEYDPDEEPGTEEYESSTWVSLTLDELEELANAHEGDPVTFIIPIVAGKSTEFSPEEVLKLAKRIRRKRW